ncbi:acetylornithine deacetylase [Maritalea sp.]|uniref:acetylornithine deacetylase n=1 Tax=Maritalea sp. TaxID=2003361 RepID=UPI003EF213C7
MQNVKDMIAHLVSFDTVSSKSNLPLIEDVKSYLADLGINSHLVPNEDGTKTNLYATIGPNVAGGVVLSGHTDVVPVDDQNWSTDPFKVVEKDGRLYGRGTCDMKGFCAIGLALVPEMLKADLKKPIHIALSYDEEVGCLGAPFMIREMAKKLPPIDAVIVGEPTNMQVAEMHKGVHSSTIHISGLEAHSSQTHLGVSATRYAAKIINFINDIHDELLAKPYDDLPLEPNHSTINVGRVNGGIADNIVAKDCMLTFDYRVLPQEDHAVIIDKIDAYIGELEAEMKAKHAACSITQEVVWTPGFAAPKDDPAKSLAMRLAGKNETIAVPYGTEAGQFQNDGGYSTIVCGPGSIDQAHKPDEFIELSQVELGVQFIRDLIKHQASVGK